MFSRRAILQATGCLAILSPSMLLANSLVKPPFSLVNPKRSVVGESISVVNFFSYACSHCLRFENVFDAYKTDLVKKGIPCSSIPVLLDTSHVVLTKTYYSFIYLNKLQRLHRIFWDWFLLEEHSWTTVEDIQKDISMWVENNGINTKQWIEAFESRFVANMLDNSLLQVENYGITSTPCVVVNSRYLTSPVLAGGYEECIMTIEKLLESKTRVPE